MTCDITWGLCRLDPDDCWAVHRCRETTDHTLHECPCGAIWSDPDHDDRD